MLNQFHLHTTTNLFQLKVENYRAKIFNIISFSSNNYKINHDYQLIIQFSLSSYIKLSDLINLKACLSWVENNGKTTYLHGIIISTTQNVKNSKSNNTIILSSPLYPLKLSIHYVVYSQKSIPEIIRELLSSLGWNEKIHYEFLLTNEYAEQPHVTQYCESNYDFFYRLCSYWGIHFLFIQAELSPKLIISDKINLSQGTIPDINLQFNFPSGMNLTENILYNFKEKSKLISSNCIIKNYNPAQPHHISKLQSKTQHTLPSYGTYYRYQDFFNSPAEGQHLIQVRQEALDCQREIFSAKTNCGNLSPGYIFTIENHCHASLNKKFYIIEIKLQANIQTQEINNSAQLLIFEIEIFFAAINNPYQALPPTNKPMPDILGVIESERIDENGCYRIQSLLQTKQNDNLLLNKAPVYKIHPYLGNQSGFHFPLPKNTEVLITHINGDPNRPLIAGALNNSINPSPVTSINPAQHIAKTISGNQFMIEEYEHNNCLEFSAANQQLQFKMKTDYNEHAINLYTEGGDINIRAGKNFTQKALAIYQKIGNNYVLENNGAFTINSNLGNILFQSENNLVFSGKSVSAISNNNQVFNSENEVLLESSEMLFIQAAEGRSTVKNKIKILAGRNIRISSNNLISLIIGNTSITLNKNIFSVNGKIVNFICNQFNCSFSQAERPLANTSNNEILENNIALKFFDDANIPLNTESLQLLYFLTSTDTQNILSAGRLEPILFCKDTPTSDKITIKHSQLPIISLGRKKHKPKTHSLLKDAIHKEIVIDKNSLTTAIESNYLRPPIYLRIRKKFAPENFTCDQLSSEQINYFKVKGNNVTIFIHGYSVIDGCFGKEHINIEMPGDRLVSSGNNPNHFNSMSVSTYGQDCTYLRHFDSIYNALGGRIPINIDLINNQPFSDEAVDNALNGTGAHNWLLHMEYNLNCAAAGIYPFPWEQKALDYTRILGIHWPGNVVFWEAQQNAVPSGITLAILLQQLHEAGLSINIIAHSLGNLVALQALEVLADQNKYGYVDHMVVWQAAVAQHALSPINLPKSKQEKFAYFPLAHLAAKQFTILFSKRDLVLKYPYDAHDKLIHRWNIELNCPAMGYSGPNTDTIKNLKTRLNIVDQKNWLIGHSEMKIPSKDLFENIYKGFVIGKKGISKFGKYFIHS